MKRLYVLFLLLLASVSPLFAKIDTLSADTLSIWTTKGTTFDFILIDVRDTIELTQVIATATCKPYHFSLRQFVFDATIPKLPKTVATICYCASGVRSGTAAQKLSDAGFSRVYTLRGGFNNYKGIKGIYADVKLPSALPEPSMLKASTGVHNSFEQMPSNSRMYSVNNTIIVPSPLMQAHSLTILNMSGQRILSLDNPFLHSNKAIPPNPLGFGNYLVVLNDKSKTMAACKTTVIR